jgi:hypothetical protein
MLSLGGAASCADKGTKKVINENIKNSAILIRFIFPPSIMLEIAHYGCAEIWL